MNLVVVELAHLDALLVFTHFSILIFDPVFYQVVQGKDVPCVVSFGFHLALCSRLDTRFREVYLRVLKGSLPMVQGRGTGCGAAFLVASVKVGSAGAKIAHRSVSDG